MLAITLLSTVLAVDLDLNNDDSFNEATKQIAAGVLDYYDGSHYGGTVGVMSPPYYWWQSASAFSGLFTYGLITGDKQYEDLLYESLLAQTGPNWDFITDNQTMVEGNDDQGYWAMFAMDAAERDFRAPPDDKTWVSLAQNVFDQMVTRWDPDCGGGLRWQIFDWNKGYNYKNSVSTGCMFNLAARLARYTNNQTYVDWAYKIYDWMVDVKFITEPSSETVYHIYDGAGTETSCQDISTAEWSYNYGAFISGMAYLHDLLGDSGTWSDRIDIAWTRANQIFFTDDDTKAMIEPSCQPQDQCNNDQRSFRAPFSRFLGHLINFVPSYSDEVLEHLTTNANLVAKSCSGGSDGKTCGQDWSKGEWDGVYGLGEEMAALEVILNVKALKLGTPMQNPVTDEKPHEAEGYPKNNNFAKSAAASSTEASSTSTEASSTEASTTEASSTEPSSTEASSTSTEPSSTIESTSESSSEPNSSSSTPEPTSTEESTSETTVAPTTEAPTEETTEAPETTQEPTETPSETPSENPVEVPTDTQVQPQESNDGSMLSPIRWVCALVLAL